MSQLQLSPKHAALWTGAAGLVAAGCVALLLVSAHQPATAATLIAAAGEDPRVTGNRLAQDLLEAGLSPQHMCASGATVAQVGSAWDAAAVEAATVAVAMDQARAGIESASKAVQRLERLVRRGQAKTEDLTELAAQRTLLATHTGARDALIADIRAEAIARLDATSRTRLDRLHGPDIGLDAVYRVIDWDQADAVALREAVADVHVSTKRGREPADASTQLIADAESDPAIAAAKTHMASRMAPIQAEWDALIAGE